MLENSSTKIISGIFDNSQKAEAAFDALQGVGSDSAHLAVTKHLLSKPVDRTDLLLTNFTVGGAILGFILGFLAVIYIHGLQYFFSILPLLSALCGVGVGGVIGILTGAFIHFEADGFALRPAVEKESLICISTKTQSIEERYQVEEVLENAGAKETFIEPEYPNPIAA